jgi:hypothetical protein
MVQCALPSGATNARAGPTVVDAASAAHAAVICQRRHCTLVRRPARARLGAGDATRAPLAR